MKEKSIAESEINNWFFLIIKQEVFGSKSSPLETEVPGNNGLINDFTKRGISFFCMVVRFSGELRLRHKMLIRWLHDTKFDLIK